MCGGPGAGKGGERNVAAGERATKETRSERWKGEGRGKRGEGRDAIPKRYPNFRALSSGDNARLLPLFFLHLPLLLL